jgi:hypothetical protein
MKRSHQVSAPLLAAAALALLNGCRQQQMKRCVDEQNHVVDDSLCQNQPGQNNGVTFMPYHFYYGGTGGFTPGSVVSGGSYLASPGVSYTTRGGFGSSFAGGGAHGSGAGSSGAGE